MLCAGVMCRMPKKKDWICPFGPDEHEGRPQHVVQTRLALRRHLVLCHGHQLVQIRTLSGEMTDRIVPIPPEQLQQQRDIYRSYQRHRRVAAAVRSSSSEAERPIPAAVRPPLRLNACSLQARPAEYRTPGHTDSSSSAPSSVGGDFEDWEANLSPGAQYLLSGGHGPSRQAVSFNRELGVGPKFGYSRTVPRVGKSGGHST